MIMKQGNTCTYINGLTNNNKKWRLYLHKLQLYIKEQHSESFKCWSAISRFNTKGKSLIMNIQSWYKDATRWPTIVYNWT